MQNIFTVLIILLSFLTSLNGQQIDLSYYLPEDGYDKSIPTPESVIGFQVGEWHVSHDKLNEYFKVLAEKSNKASLSKYAKSHEDRDLLYLVITSEKNQNNLSQIKEQHKKLKTEDANEVDIEKLPAIIYQGYNVHGNESSGGNASMLVAYYLLAGQSDYVNKLLDEVVIVLDPCFNPDGFQRFASWVNANKHTHLNPDENSREFNEPWPGGRTNHYWFDLNRDWLFLIHPSSQGRIKNFYEWSPNVLTDHHEMGKNSSFFFQPGVPSRTNPMTPQLNQDITEEIGTYHAHALDSIGSDYFTKERFDDYYYGKGSTYPDINGCIGILFEQASSRGHLQETTNGLLSYPFTIRNQVVTSFSTHKATLSLRTKLLEFKRDFYANSRKICAQDSVLAYQFSHDDEKVESYFKSILTQHNIQFFHSRAADDKLTSAACYTVPCKQEQYRLIKTIFEPVHSFPDSIFYDVSTWSFPLSLQLDWHRITDENEFAMIQQAPVPGVGVAKNSTQSNYYAIDASSQSLAKTKYILQREKIPFLSIKEAVEIEKNKFLDPGTVLISLMEDGIKNKLDNILSDEKGLKGVRFNGYNIKKKYAKQLKMNPSEGEEKVAMLVGRGLGPYDAGYIWHQFDIKWEVPLSHLDIDRLRFIKLEKYTTIIIPNLNGSISKENLSKLKDWVENGGHLIIVKSNLQVLADEGFLKVSVDSNLVLNRLRKIKDTGPGQGAQVIGGAILNAELDLSHPFCFGYKKATLPVFHQGNIFYKSEKMMTVADYSEDLVLSGYISKENRRIAKGKNVVSTKKLSNGRISHFSINPCFRGYFYATNKLLENAVFNAHLVN